MTETRVTGSGGSGRRSVHPSPIPRIAATPQPAIAYRLAAAVADHPFGDDHAGADLPHQHRGALEFLGQCIGEVLQAPLGRAVDAHAREILPVAAPPEHVEQLAVTLRVHSRDGHARAVDGADQIGGDHGLDIGLGRLGDGVGRSRQAGVVDPDIYCAKLGNGGIPECLHLGDVDDITRLTQGATGRCTQLLQRRIDSSL